MYIERKRPEDEEDFTNTQREFKKEESIFVSNLSFYIFTTHRLIKNKIKKHILQKTYFSPKRNVDLYQIHISCNIHHI